MEEYDVRLTNHAEALLGRVNDLRKIDAFADVLLYCEDRMVRAHKVILASSSAYWDAVFRRLPPDVAAARYPLVVLPDTPIAVLELVLEFIYMGQVSVPSDQMKEFMDLADTLQIRGFHDARRPTLSSSSGQTPSIGAAAGSSSNSSAAQVTPVVSQQQQQPPMQMIVSDSGVSLNPAMIVPDTVSPMPMPLSAVVPVPSDEPFPADDDDGGGSGGGFDDVDPIPPSHNNNNEEDADDDVVGGVDGDNTAADKDVKGGEAAPIARKSAGRPKKTTMAAVFSTNRVQVSPVKRERRSVVLKRRQEQDQHQRQLRKQQHLQKQNLKFEVFGPDENEELEELQQLKYVPDREQEDEELDVEEELGVKAKRVRTSVKQQQQRVSAPATAAAPASAPTPTPPHQQPQPPLSRGLPRDGRHADEEDRAAASSPDGEEVETRLLPGGQAVAAVNGVEVTIPNMVSPEEKIKKVSEYMWKGVHMTTKTQIFFCTQCGFTSPWSKVAHDHQRTHTGERPYPCPKCGKNFSIQSNLRRHLRNVHNIKDMPGKQQDDHRSAD